MLGIDLVDISRKEFENPRLAHKILTFNELIKYYANENKKKFLAKTFCIKEAILKAVNKKFNYNQIDLEFIPNNCPTAKIPNGEINISISYQNQYLIAVCLWKNQN